MCRFDRLLGYEKFRGRHLLSQSRQDRCWPFSSYLLKCLSGFKESLRFRVLEMVTQNKLIFLRFCEVSKKALGFRVLEMVTQNKLIFLRKVIKEITYVQTTLLTHICLFWVKDQDIPEQKCRPSPRCPDWQLQSNDPAVFVQLAAKWQSWLPSLHSSISK